MNRYKIRMFESGEGDGNIDAGTIVLPIDRRFSLNAGNSDEVERRIKKEVMDGRLAGGRVYQICPEIHNPEKIRSIAVCPEAKVTTVYLDPAKGLYSEFKRIRYADLRRTPRDVHAEAPRIEAEQNSALVHAE